MLSILMGSLGCASDPGGKSALVYDSEGFRSEILARVPEMPLELARPPYEVDAETAARARRFVMAAPRGPARVQALVDFIMSPRPEGLGLVYDWRSSGTAATTLASGSGNCVSLASVLVGLGRSLDWPVYFAEARTRRPDVQTFEEVVALSDHMAVLVVARTVQMVIDFTGRIEDVYDIRPIDDLTAYAHILNNSTAQSVMSTTETTGTKAWQNAVAGFELVTRIEPGLGPAWNNLGIALAKLDRFDEARVAYRRAVELDTVFGSPEKNLTMMETRASGAPTIIESPIGD